MLPELYDPVEKCFALPGAHMLLVRDSQVLLVVGILLAEPKVSTPLLTSLVDSCPT